MTEDISPAVKILESNYSNNSNINPTQNIALFVGEFEKGNINEPVLITSALEFKLTFGRALDFNFNSWYQVYNYLQYPGSPKIWVCRTSGLGDTIESTANNNGNIASSPGTWGNLLTVEIYNNLDYNNSNYLKEIFGLYNNSNYYIIVKRKDTIVEKFSINNSDDIKSQYLKEVNLERGVYELSGGINIPATETDYENSLNIFTKEDYEIDLVISVEEFNEIAIEFVESRKDCVVFCSIPRRYVQYLLVNSSVLTTENNDLIVLKDYKLKNKLDENDYNNIKEYISTLQKSSYCFLSFGFKYQIDKFTDKKRLISLSGDLAGLKSAASFTNPWSIGAGLERGRIKDYVYLPMKVPKNKSDELYKLGVNVIENGILMSQKMFNNTGTRMNQRNIFNYLERKCEKLLRRHIFNLNDLRLRGLIASELKLLLEDMMVNRGIEAGKVIVSTSGTNNFNNIVINIYIKMINISEIVKIGLSNTGTNDANLVSQIQIKGL